MNHWGTDNNDVRGRALRFLLTRELHNAGRPLTVKELAVRIERLGFTIYGRASKTISDSLRWEIAKGRVRRLSRGVYAFGHGPKTTLARVYRLADACQQWIVAMTRSHSTNQHLRSPGLHAQSQQLERNRPWYDYQWLWRM